MKSVGSPLPQRVAKAGPQPMGLQTLSLSGTSARFWWDISTWLNRALLNEDRAGILHCCPAPSPLSFGFVQAWADFLPQAQRAGETRGCRCPQPGATAFVSFQSHQNKDAVVHPSRHPHSLSRRLMIGGFALWFSPTPIFNLPTFSKNLSHDSYS